MDMDPWSNKYKSMQGNVGLGIEIAYFTSNCIPVLIPLNDTQKYDLVVDMDGALKRVSVKTTQALNKSGKCYQVLLKNCGGSSGNAKTRLFDKNTCDLVLIYTKNDDIYLIPSKEINVTNTLTLTGDYDKYKVFFRK